MWQSKADANREAGSDHVLSLRSRLRYLAATTDELMLEVKSGYMPAGVGALWDAAKQPAHFPHGAQQRLLPS